MQEREFSGTRLAIQVLVMGLALTPVIYFAVQYPDLPDRIPVHFNARGQVDGWARKTVLTVFFPGVLTLIVQMLLWLLTNDLSAAVRQADGSGEGSRTLKGDSLRASLQMLEPLRVILAFLLFLATFALPVSKTSGIPAGVISMLLIASVGALLVATGAGVWRIVKLQNKWAATAPSSLPELQAANWQLGGAFYYNPADPAFIVHKMIGVGFTINFAHARAKWYGLLFAVLMAVVAAGVIDTVRGGR